MPLQENRKNKYNDDAYQHKNQYQQIPTRVKYRTLPQKNNKVQKHKKSSQDVRDNRWQDFW